MDVQASHRPAPDATQGISAEQAAQHSADRAAVAEAAHDNAAATPATEAGSVPDDSQATRSLASRNASVRFSDGQGMHAQAQQSARASAQATARNATAATRQLAATTDEVVALGERIASSDGPVSDADREAWVQSQARLRDEVTGLANAVAGLPPDAPERQAAQAEIGRLSERLAALELPVLAKFDTEMGKSWALFTGKQRDSEGAVLDTRLKMYGLTREDLHKYVTTGEQPAGLKRALNDAQRRGEWPALGVVRAAFMMRADYLRATTSPDDAQSRALAGQLDATAADLSRHRAAIHLDWGTKTVTKILSNKDTADDTKRTPIVQQQLDEAKRAIASVRQRAVEQVNANPSRHAANSGTRTLAADGLAVEANIAQAEAQLKMKREQDALNKATNERNQAAAEGSPKIVPPAAKIHPDMVEGGTVDRKRDEAVKIDPRLGDVVKGGDRAVNFTRDVLGTRKFRLASDEQQLAHLQSKQRAADAVYGPRQPTQRPPAELEARVNTQLERIYKDTLSTHDRLTSQKAGSLGVEQTKLLAELGSDARAFSGRIAGNYQQKQDVAANQSLRHQQQQLAQQTRNEVAGQIDAVRQQKVERLTRELEATQHVGSNSYKLFQLRQNPKEFADSQPNSAAEQARLDTLSGQLRDVDAALISGNGLNELATKSTDDLAHAKRVDDLDGLTSDAKSAVASAKEALGRADAHFNAIPAKGPERGARLQAALDHQAAKAGLAVVERDNADAFMARAQVSHKAVVTWRQREPMGLGPDSVGNSATANAALVREETAIKRAALTDATRAADKSETLRKQLATEVTTRGGDQLAVQKARDTLAAQQARMHGVVAEIAADVDPTAAKTQLDQAGRIIEVELPETHVARLDTQQAARNHARNEARADALATLGEQGIAVAHRAANAGGIDRGTLGIDAKAIATDAAARAHRTLTIDGGGAAAATADQEKHAGLRERADGVNAAAMQLDRDVDVQKFTDALDSALYDDAVAFNKTIKLMEEDVDSRGFGFFMEFVSGAMAGFGLQERSVNDEAYYVGMLYLRDGIGKGQNDARMLSAFSQQLRELRQAGVSDHLIMAAIRDPRIASADPAQRAQWEADFGKVTGGRFNVKLPESFATTVNRVQRETPLGQVLQNARSNATGDLNAQIGHKNADLLGNAQIVLRDGFEQGAQDWGRFKAYAALGKVVDQVVLSVASSALLAGAFARVAAATTIPQRFDAARLVAAGLSAPAKIAMLGGINAAETTLGMVTGALISKVGNGLFGEGSKGAMIFNAVGGGLQLNVGSAVAMRTGIAFQTGLGLAMGSVPIVAEQLGASPALAEKLGTAVGIFLPTVMGTMGNLRGMSRAEGLLTHQLGVDPSQARAATNEASASANASTTAAGGDSIRERMGRMVDTRFGHLDADARAKLADTYALDVVRARLDIDPPVRGTPEQLTREIESYYSRLESELVGQGVSPDRARELVAAEKNTMFSEALATTNGLLEGSQRQVGTPDASSAGGAGASTRHTAVRAVERIAAAETQPGAQGAAPANPWQANQASVADRSARLRAAEDGMVPINGIARDMVRARDAWPSLGTVQAKLNFVRDLVNQRLQAQGLPPVMFVSRLERGDNVAGQYTPRQHEVGITEHVLNARELSDVDVVFLTTVVRHEVEHMAQWVDMARVLAARGLKEPEIRSAMGGNSLQVSDEVVTWAVTEQRAGRGIDLNSPRGLAAANHLESVYSGAVNEHGQQRREVLEWMHREHGRYATAKAEYDQAVGTPRENAALANRELARERFEEAERAYQELSEEHGAHVAGELAGAEARALVSRDEPQADAVENARTGVYNVHEATTRPGANGNPRSPGVDTNGSTVDTRSPGVNTNGQTVDTNSPARNAAADAVRARIVSPRRPPDNEVMQVRTVSGPEQMTAGEYRNRYEMAKRWISEQLAFTEKWRTPNGQSMDLGVLQQRAAEMFGLDRNWQRINNPIINGPL